MPKRGGGANRRGSPQRRGRPPKRQTAQRAAGTDESRRPAQQWMEGVHSEEDLQQTHIAKIYHLEEAPCEEEGHGANNCEENPNCLLGLGEGGEGVWAECPPTIEELGDDPHTQARQPDVPAGLENLGATCYMNNVLQCLFMNTAFRQGVYAWGTGDDFMVEEETEAEPARGKEKQSLTTPDAAEAHQQDDSEQSKGELLNNKDSVCLELQRLFALMQQGCRSYYTPKNLTKALNLKTSIQQDAQEFYKLFLDYLEERFRQSSNESVKNLVQQFQGEYAYTTVCQACKNVSQRKCQFSELELNLKDAKTIDDSLMHFLGEEQLTDGNQYFCENCNMLRDATRSIVLLNLPKVLNLQLMRFVYDIKTYQKRKLQDSIAFPLEIDMGKYVQDFDERQNEVENKRRRKGSTYELVGVLIHVGPGANVGHYIAHIKDDVTKKWWRFDDAVVTPLDENKIGIEKEPKKNRKKGPATVLSEGMTESSNSYMLIYALKDRETLAQPQLPTSASAFVEIDNKDFEKSVEEYDVLAKAERQRIEAHKQSYTTHFSTLIAQPDAKDYNWITSSWLRKWVIGAQELPPIDNTELMCAHDMLDPRKLSQAKRITSGGWSLLQSQFKGGPVLSQECYCMPCSAALCHELSRDVEYNRMKESTLNLIAAGPPSKGYILSTAWLNQWKKKNEPEDLSRNMNEKITCEHGNLCPAGGRRVIPAQAWSWLRSEFSEGAEFHSSESACKECIRDTAANKVELQQLKVIKAKEKHRVNTVASEKEIKPGFRYNVISQEWFARWRAWVENVPDTDEPNPITNESLFCCHDQLHIFIGQEQFPINPEETEFRLVTPELWAKLIKRGADRAVTLQAEHQQNGLVFRVDPPVCVECTEARQNMKIDQQHNYEEAEIVVTTKRRTSGGRARRSKVLTDKITVSADDTILVVKLKILEKLEIEPNEQVLFFNDVELKDSKATLRQYKVPAKATVFIERRQLSMADYDILDGHDQIEEGFKGTIFSHERVPEPTRDEQQQQQQQPPLSEASAEAPSEGEAQSFSCQTSWTCDMCTFDNPDDAMLCSMCNSPRLI